MGRAALPFDQVDQVFLIGQVHVIGYGIGAVGPDSLVRVLFEGDQKDLIGFKMQGLSLPGVQDVFDVGQVPGFVCNDAEPAEWDGEGHRVKTFEKRFSIIERLSTIIKAIMKLVIRFSVGRREKYP